MAANLDPRASRSFAVRLATRFGVHDAGRLLRDFSVYFPARVISAFAAAVALPIIARRVPPTELGTLALAQTLINLGWIVSMQWLTATVMRELPRHRELGDVPSFRRALLRVMALVIASFALFAAFVWIAGLASSAIRQNEGIVILAAAALSMQNLTTTLFLANLRPVAYAVFETVGRVGGIALGIRLVFLGHGVHGYLVGLAVVPAVVGILGLPLAWPRAHRRTEHREAVGLRGWIGYGVPAAVSASIMWGVLFVDRYMLALLKTTGDVGVYSLGAVVGSQAVLIPAFALSSVARPLLYQSYEADGREAVEAKVRAYTRLLLMLVVPVVAFIAVASGPLIRFLSHGFFGQYYTDAIRVAPLLAFATALQSLGYIGNVGIAISRKMRLQLVGTGSALTVTVIGNVILITAFGIIGCAVATVIGSAVLLLAPRRLASHYVVWRFPWSTLLRTVVAAAAGSGVGYLVRSAVSGDLSQVIAVAVAGGAVYAVALAVLRENVMPHVPHVHEARAGAPTTRLP